MGRRPDDLCCPVLDAAGRYYVAASARVHDLELLTLNIRIPHVPETPSTQVTLARAHTHAPSAASALPLTTSPLFSPPGRWARTGAPRGCRRRARAVPAAHATRAEVGRRAPVVNAPGADAVLIDIDPATPVSSARRADLFSANGLSDPLRRGIGAGGRAAMGSCRTSISPEPRATISTRELPGIMRAPSSLRSTPTLPWPARRG
jgi:hypothetical protein